MDQWLRQVRIIKKGRSKISLDCPFNYLIDTRMFCDFVGLLPLLSPARTCPACCPWWSKWVVLIACPRGSWTRPHSSSFSRSDQGIFFSNAELAIFWAEVRGPGAYSRLIGLAPAPGKIGGSDFRLHNSNLYF